jgi:acyl-CoA thioester hydrolase
LKIRVYYEDTDVSGNLYHSNYLNYCERDRSELFFSRGLSPILPEGHFVVSGIDAKFLKSAKFSDLLDVKTEVARIRGASVELIQEIFREDEKLFSSRVKLAFLNGDKPTRIPDETLKIFKEGQSV